MRMERIRAWLINRLYCACVPLPISNEKVNKGLVAQQPGQPWLGLDPTHLISFLLLPVVFFV